MEYTDEEYYTYTCMNCNSILQHGEEKPEDHVIRTGHGSFIVTPSIIRKYIMDDYFKIKKMFEEEKKKKQ